MYKKKFFFIVFEGVEGTGKSYQIKKLYKSLKKKKYKVETTREPGGNINAEKIRKLIFSKKSNNFDDLTDFYLMLASRNEHIKKTIIEAQKKKYILICDRFTDSTYAYQVVGKKISKKINILNNKYIVGSLKPDLTIVLKSKIKTALDRIKKRKKSNKFDKLRKDFYVKAQKAFVKISKFKSHYYLFDTTINNKDVEKKIFHLVIKKLNN
ncbi:MAG: dTMP kinase [Candidatus Pelagibacter sp.]|nr:dTMP kinase [Candidatus Pelagibacter sp.]